MNWVSIGESKPRQDGVYLVWLSGGFLQYDLWLYREESHKSGWGDNKQVGEVTHWMKIEAPNAKP